MIYDRVIITAVAADDIDQSVRTASMYVKLSQHHCCLRSPLEWFEDGFVASDFRDQQGLDSSYDCEICHRDDEHSTSLPGWVVVFKGLL